jgi:hypothetical protein
MDPTELERRVDRALKALPAPGAPPALLSNVLRRVAAADGVAAPATSAVFEWPLALKLALSVLSAVLIISGLTLWPRALELARPGWESPVVVLLRVVVSAVRPMVPVALLYLAAMCTAAAAAVSLLKHVALGGASQS